VKLTVLHRQLPKQLTNYQGGHLLSETDRKQIRLSYTLAPCDCPLHCVCLLSYAFELLQLTCLKSPSPEMTRHSHGFY